MICLINIELTYHTQTAGHFLSVTSLLRREFGSVYHMTVPNMVFCLSYDCSKYGSHLLDFNIVILRWPVGSRTLHQNTTVIRRVTTVRTERGVRLTVCQGDVS